MLVETGRRPHRVRTVDSGQLNRRISTCLKTTNDSSFCLGHARPVGMPTWASIRAIQRAAHFTVMGAVAALECKAVLNGPVGVRGRGPRHRSVAGAAASLQLSSV